MSNPKIAPPTAEELRRLSLVRHLYGLGVTQSRGTEPTAGLSILPFHDAAESFLQFACERYDAGENKADFMRYWELLAAKNVAVPQRETMRRLNAARRGLKHQGILPAYAELEGFRAAVTNLLYDSSRTLFGIDFDKISLVNLVSDSAVREKLEEAYKALAEHDHQTALGATAVAFILVHRAHERNQASSLPPHTPVSLRARMSRTSFTDAFIYEVERELGGVIGRSLRTITANHNHVVAILSETIEMLNYGLDLKAHLLFRSYIPSVHEFPGGTMTIQCIQEPTGDPDIVGRCLGFVVDVAVRFGV